MGEAQHTPGPWSITPRRGGDKEIIVRQDGDSWHRMHAAVDCDDCDLDMAIANAHLIAAAPDLYAALEHILGGALSLPRFVEEEARAALTKANPSAVSGQRGEG